MKRDRGESLALVGGTVLIGFGLLSLANQLFPNFVRGSFVWPVAVILVGALFFAAMFIGGTTVSGLAIPGSIIGGIGLLLLVQNFAHVISLNAKTRQFPARLGPVADGPTRRTGPAVRVPCARPRHRGRVLLSDARADEGTGEPVAPVGLAVDGSDALAGRAAERDRAVGHHGGHARQ